MAQQEYPAKPQKALAEQFFTATEPPPKGVCFCTQNPSFPPGQHAHTETQGWAALKDTDWIVFHWVFTDRLDAVMPDAEFRTMYNVD